MERRELLERITKLEVKIEKKKKTLEKNYSKLSEETIKRLPYLLSLKWYEFQKEVREMGLSKIIEVEEEIEIDNYRRARSDLETFENTLVKYKNQLREKEEFDDKEKVEVIWNFLLSYKEEMRKYIIENAALFRKLYEKREEEYLKVKDQYEAHYNYKNNYLARLKWEEKYYKDIHTLTKQLSSCGYRLDEERLEKILQQDIESKYKNITAKVEKKCGEIVDASHLSIGHDGSLNGYIIGTKDKAYVETIYAGGYNIQCLHYRVIVR